MPLEVLDLTLVLLCLRQDEKVPRLRRFPVLSSFLREYSRYCPDLSFLIICLITPQNEFASLSEVSQGGRYMLHSVS